MNAACKQHILLFGTLIGCSPDLLTQRMNYPGNYHGVNSLILFFVSIGNFPQAIAP